MRKIRIIPRLDIKGPNVVKGVQTEGLHIVGNPADLAKAYYHSGADELIYMDIVASLYGRNVDYNIVRSVSNQIFIPLTVGGGIRSIHDIHAVLSNGADKVAINTHAVKNPFFLNEAVQVFGSQCIVLSIEAKKILLAGKYTLTVVGKEQVKMRWSGQKKQSELELEKF